MIAMANRTALDSHVHRRRLQLALRQARLGAGKTQQEVAAALEWSLSKVVRIESGAVRVSSTDLRALLHLYGMAATRVDALVEEVKAARQPSWWRNYEDLLGRDFVFYLGLESSATQIRQFQAGLVPGLLQTEHYARAILTAVWPGEDVEELVEARLRRQQVLERADAPLLTFVIDEAALHRRIGGPAVMAEQVERLESLAAMPDVSILVLPFDAGAHAGLAGSFVLLNIGDDRAVYLEDAEGGLLRRDDPPVADDYERRFQRLAELAEPIETSLHRLSQIGDWAPPPPREAGP
jgi:transcriptional regulator with XRE-family HTH domain